MSRKSTLITLGILGAVALGACGCCCLSQPEPHDEQAQNAEDKDKKDGGGRHGSSSRGVRWLPLFFGGGVAHGTGPAHTGGGTSSGTSRGGFGATGSSHGGGVGA
ncbi:MAG: hypothetical protein EXR98_03065 [Gemmataceae bacterium]|nr:hypothetical protein [Gemmataceae bacterium]